MGIQELREKRTALAREARNLLDKHTGAAWTDDINARYEGIMDEIDRVDAEISRHEKVLDLEAANRARIGRQADSQGISADEAVHNETMDRQVFTAWLRGGREALTPEQREHVARKAAEVRNTMSTTTAAEGGYLVPSQFAAQLLEEMKAYGGVREVANVVPTSTGALIEWPTVDETAQEGEIVGQNAQVGEQDVEFGIVNIGAFKYSSKAVAVPFELLQDSEIDLEGYIRKALTERIARITNRHFTVGAGTTEPRGVVTCAAEGKVGATGQTAAIVYEDLVDLEHSIDPVYRKMGTVRWMMHDQTLKVMKKLKDADQKPLWVPGVAVKEPDTILGYPFGINQHMAAMAANAKSLLFGDFSKYLVRDVMQVMLFRMTDSAYTKKGQVGFLAFSRHDGNLVASSSSCLKYYQNSAT